MATNRTFTMIKPDAVENNYIGGILAKINESGFRIVAMKYTKLSKDAAGKFTGRKKLLWDAVNMKITNFDVANEFVKRTYRNGWDLKAF